MDSWDWIVVYALGLTLPQLLVYQYLVNGGEPTVDRGSGRDSAQTDRYTYPEIAVSLDDSLQVGVQTTPVDERIRSNCGAENKTDATSDLCWNCTRRLRRRLVAKSVLSTLA